MREQRVLLEHHADIAFVGRNAGDRAAVDQNLAAGHVLEPGEHHQAGGFTRAGGAEQGNKFALGHIQVEVFDHQMLVVVRLLDVGELQECFIPSLISHTPPRLCSEQPAACGRWLHAWICKPVVCGNGYLFE